jgi:hypothetical protein
MATQISGAASMDQEAYESFLVRIWRKPVANTEECQWCGEIEQIQNGLRWGFCTLTDLLAFLQEAAGAQETATPPDAT